MSRSGRAEPSGQSGATGAENQFNDSEIPF